MVEITPAGASALQQTNSLAQGTAPKKATGVNPPAGETPSIKIDANLLSKVENEIATDSVDAPSDAESAKAQALEAQQQLATQTLSIANQAPQNVQSLFR